MVSTLVTRVARGKHFRDPVIGFDYICIFECLKAARDGKDGIFDRVALRSSEIPFLMET